jgi:hypothetical protein
MVNVVTLEVVVVVQQVRTVALAERRAATIDEGCRL